MKNKSLFFILVFVLSGALLVGCTASAEGVGRIPQKLPEREPALVTDADIAKPEATQPSTEATQARELPTVMLCQTCGDDDCDDGIYCDDAHEKQENLREAENRKNGTPCQTCGEYDCDDGAYCDDWDDHDDRDDRDDHDDHDDHRHGRHHGRHHDD